MSTRLHDQIATLYRAFEWVRCWGTAVDGGAFEGWWSAAMAERFERVVAFEPAERNHRVASSALAGLLNVELRRQALFSAATKVRVEIERELQPSTHFIRPDDAGDVEAIRLDSLGLESVGLIKFDLEGADYDGLVGARKTIRRCRPVMIVEVKQWGKVRFGRDPSLVREFMAKAGYREIYAQKPDVIFVPEP